MFDTLVDLVDVPVLDERPGDDPGGSFVVVVAGDDMAHAVAGSREECSALAGVVAAAIDGTAEAPTGAESNRRMVWVAAVRLAESPEQPVDTR